MPFGWNEPVVKMTLQESANRWDLDVFASSFGKLLTLCKRKLSQLRSTVTSSMVIRQLCLRSAALDLFYAQLPSRDQFDNYS